MFISKTFFICICLIVFVNANFETRRSEDRFLNDLNVLSEKESLERQERRIVDKRQIRLNDQEKQFLESRIKDHRINKRLNENLFNNQETEHDRLERVQQRERESEGRVELDSRLNNRIVDREIRNYEFRTNNRRQKTGLNDRLSDNRQIRLERESRIREERRNERQEIRDNRRELRENHLEDNTSEKMVNRLNTRSERLERRLNVRNDHLEESKNRLNSRNHEQERIENRLEEKLQRERRSEEDRTDRNRLDRNEDIEIRSDRLDNRTEKRERTRDENRREMNNSRLEKRLENRSEKRSSEQREFLNEKSLGTFDYTSLLLTAVTSYLTLAIPKKHVFGYLNQFKETLSF